MDYLKCFDVCFTGVLDSPYRISVGVDTIMRLARGSLLHSLHRLRYQELILHIRYWQADTTSCYKGTGLGDIRVTATYDGVSCGGEAVPPVPSPCQFFHNERNVIIVCSAIQRLVDCFYESTI